MCIRCGLGRDAPQPALLLLIHGLLHKEVETAFCGIGFELGVPLLPIPLQEPIPEFAEFFFRERVNGHLDFFDSGHGSFTSSRA